MICSRSKLKIKIVYTKVVEHPVYIRSGNADFCLSKTIPRLKGIIQFNITRKGTYINTNIFTYILMVDCMFT